MGKSARLELFSLISLDVDKAAAVLSGINNEARSEQMNRTTAIGIILAAQPKLDTEDLIGLTYPETVAAVVYLREEAIDSGKHIVGTACHAWISDAFDDDPNNTHTRCAGMDEAWDRAEARNRRRHADWHRREFGYDARVHSYR